MTTEASSQSEKTPSRATHFLAGKEKEEEEEAEEEEAGGMETSLSQPMFVLSRINLSRALSFSSDHVTVDFFGTGSVLGEMGLLDERKRNASVESETAVQVGAVAVTMETGVVSIKARVL